MARKNRTPEENARREKIRELLQMANIGSMEDIQSMFKETIAEFMENGLEAELDDELGYSKYDYKNKDTDNSRNGHSSKTLRTSFGDVEVSVPRDWKGEFEPKVLKKNQTSISQDIEESFCSVLLHIGKLEQVVIDNQVIVFIQRGQPCFRINQINLVAGVILAGLLHRRKEDRIIVLLRAQFIVPLLSKQN